MYIFGLNRVFVKSVKLEVYPEATIKDLYNILEIKRRVVPQCFD